MKLFESGVCPVQRDIFASNLLLHQPKRCYGATKHGHTPHLCFCFRPTHATLCQIFESLPGETLANMADFSEKKSGEIRECSFLRFNGVLSRTELQKIDTDKSVFSFFLGGTIPGTMNIVGMIFLGKASYHHFI